MCWCYNRLLANVSEIPWKASKPSKSWLNELKKKSFKWWHGCQKSLEVHNNFKIPLLNSPNWHATFTPIWKRDYPQNTSRLQRAGLKLRMSWKVKEQLIKGRKDITSWITTIPYYEGDYLEKYSVHVLQVFKQSFQFKIFPDQCLLQAGFFSFLFILLLNFN